MDPITFSTICPTINYSFSLINETVSYYPEILVIKFTGEYRDGSTGNSDAKLMKGIINLATDLWSPDAILIDLSDFKYEWGDFIENVFVPIGNKPLGVIVGAKCRKGLSTLFLGVETEKDIVDDLTFFDSYEMAVQALKK